MITFLGFSSQAQEVKKSKNAKAEIQVNGNCEMCKKRIEKAAFGVSGVKSAVWNVETHQMKLMLNEEKCSLLDVEKAIAKAGHDTQNVKAEGKDYENLHGCCQYERK